MAQIAWTLDETREGIRHREFSVPVDGRGTIPAVLWTPEGTDEPLPLILSAHGGSHHKKHPTMLLLRDHLMEGAPAAVATIDFEGHGDRGEITSTEDESLLDLLANPASPASAASELSATLSALLGTEEFDASAVAYFGVSMGAWFGIPFLANEARVGAAVLGLVGTQFDFLERVGRPRLTEPVWERAREIELPTFLFAQESDEVVSLDSTVELFKLLASPHKRFLVAPGGHAFVPQDVFAAGIAFLKHRLAGGSEPDPFLAPIFAPVPGR